MFRHRHSLSCPAKAEETSREKKEDDVSIKGRFTISSPHCRSPAFIRKIFRLIRQFASRLHNLNPLVQTDELPWSSPSTTTTFCFVTRRGLCPPLSLSLSPHRSLSLFSFESDRNSTQTAYESTSRSSSTSSSTTTTTDDEYNAQITSETVAIVLLTFLIVLLHLLLVLLLIGMASSNVPMEA